MERILRDLNLLLKNVDFEYAICGGLAIDEFIGHKTRNHSDIDIAVFFEDKTKIFKFMLDLGWDVYEALGNSRVKKITSLTDYEITFKNLLSLINDNVYKFEFLRTNQEKLDYVEFLFNSKENDNWIYQYNENIKLSLSNSIISGDNFKYLSPSIVLLYKSREVDNLKNKRDFRSIINKLNIEQLNWLYSSLQLEYEGRHPNIDYINYSLLNG